MTERKDPNWEVVDEIPGERPAKPSQKPAASVIKNKLLWTGVLIGAAVVLMIPALRVLAQNALRHWWLWLALALYWFWRRLQRAPRKK